MEYLAESKGMTEEFRESLTPREQKKYAPEMDLTSSLKKLEIQLRRLQRNTERLECRE
jgi:hypothetical protein